MSLFVTFSVRVTPRAGRNAFFGVYDNAYKVALKAVAVDGKANKALVKFLSKKLRVPQDRIIIVSGAKNRCKAIRIDGMTEDDLKERIS